MLYFGDNEINLNESLYILNEAKIEDGFEYKFKNFIGNAENLAKLKDILLNKSDENSKVDSKSIKGQSETGEIADETAKKAGTNIFMSALATGQKH